MTFDSPGTPGVEFRMSEAFPGYCFGNDGSYWSSLKRAARTADRWRQCKVSLGGHAPIFMLSIGGKQVSRAARLVLLEVFAGPCPAGHEPESIDGDAENLATDNLRWSLPIDARLWNRLDRMPSGCWEWRGGRTRDGHGKISPTRGCYYAHQLAYEAAVGPRNGLMVLHSCDNPPCCNPAHLFLGTNADNVRDMVEKGRTCSPLAEADVREIRARHAAGETLKSLGAAYGIWLGSVQRIVKRKTWRHVV